MLHSKLMAMGGITTMTKASATFNRLQFVIENSVNGSIVATTTYSPRRYQHVLCAKSTTIPPTRVNIENAQYHSVLSKKSTTSVSISKKNKKKTKLKFIQFKFESVTDA